MENTSTEKIINIVKQQKEFFRSGATLDIRFRRQMLGKLLSAMTKWEKKISDALWTDLHKSYEEAYLTEISIVTGEIRNHMTNVRKWSRRKRAHSPLKLFPSRTSWKHSDHISMELSCPAAAQSFGRSDFSRMYSGSEAVSLCTDSFQSNRRNDFRNI